MSTNAKYLTESQMQSISDFIQIATWKEFLRQDLSDPYTSLLTDAELDEYIARHKIDLRSIYGR